MRISDWSSDVCSSDLVFHRSAHRVRWFWASHVIHHSSQHYNLSTALRQTWTGFFSLSFIFRLPLFLIGFPPPLVRSEEHTSELQSLMRISYAVFCLKTKTHNILSIY